MASASEVIDHRYDWRCADWKGRPWHESVFLDVLVGLHFPPLTDSGRAWSKRSNAELIGTSRFRGLLRGGAIVGPQLGGLFRDLPVAVLADA